MTQQVRVGAYAVCIRDGRILLTHQISEGAGQNKWSLPGGGLDFGESPEAGARRETREETGSDARIGSLLGVHSTVFTKSADIHVHRIGLLFSATLDAEPRAPMDGEIDDVGWFDLADLPDARTEFVGLAIQLHQQDSDSKTQKRQGV